MTHADDDGCAGGDQLLRLDAAGARIAAGIRPVRESEAVALAEADGRVLAADLDAPHDLPPFDNAAVDGYALRAADLATSGPTRLPVRGRVLAGSAPHDPAGGYAVRIFTGAPVPEGADTVVMQEDVRLDGASVLVPAGLRAGANRRRAGEDIARGARALPAGRRLSPRDLALAASFGLDRLTVRRRPRVALFSTGDEVTEPGMPLGPAAIYDANRAMLASLIRRGGCEPVDLGILRDAADALAIRLADAARGHDLVLTSGGVSVGEADHVKAAVARIGTIGFWRLAIKPGKPVAVGSVADTPFVGLPGNPVAAYVTFAFVVRPLLARLAGATVPEPQGLTVRSAFAHAKKPGRREFLRVTLQQDAEGWLAACPARGGALTGLAGSEALADIPEDQTALAIGDPVRVHPYAMLE